MSEMVDYQARVEQAKHDLLAQEVKWVAHGLEGALVSVGTSVGSFVAAHYLTKSEPIQAIAGFAGYCIPFILWEYHLWKSTGPKTLLEATGMLAAKHSVRVFDILRDGPSSTDALKQVLRGTVSYIGERIKISV
jgi:hypothetical protein